MKKYTHQLLFMITMLLLLSACKKSFLDQVPNDFISEEQVFTNVDNAEGFLNGCYTNIGNWFYSSGNSFLSSSMTDEGKQRWINGAIIFNNGSWNPVNFAPMSSEWTNNYNSIRSINLFLKNYNKIPEDPTDPQRKARMRGEALMLRAWYHFKLYRGWGKIPLLDQPITQAENGDAIFVPRSELSAVFAFINADIDAAIPLLRDKNEGSFIWGRGSKTICMALKSRMALYFASTLSNPTNDIARWQNAATISKQALDMALVTGYTLTEKYQDATSSYANTECIWGRSMGTGGGQTANAIDQNLQPLGYSGWSNSGPIQALVDDYEMKNGLPIQSPGSGWDPKHPYLNRDPRFYATILYPGARWKNRTINIYATDKDNPSEQGTNYWWRKYMTESLNLGSNTGGTVKAWVLFRTGELYLNYAEALNEVSGPTAEVYAAINAIRRRAGMPDVAPGLSQSLMREKIRHERRIELAFEDHRFWDVRRLKIAEVVDNRPVYGVNYTLSPTNPTDTTFSYFLSQNRFFDASKHYYFPIPQAEMDKVRGKNTNFTQSPGWPQ